MRGVGILAGRRRQKAVSCRVGLDIGSHTINGVEVVERGPEVVIRSAGSVSIASAKGGQSAPERGAIAQAVRSLWASAGFATNNVVMALPASATYLKWLHLEAADADELAQTATAAAARGAPFPANDAIVDYRVLSSRGVIGRNVHFVMLVAASAAAVDELLTIADMAGLEPLAVDIGAVAAIRSFDMQKRPTNPLWSGQPLAHCIIGARESVICVMRGGELEFARTVPVGGNDVTDCVASHLGLGWHEAEKVKTSPASRLVGAATLVTSVNHEEVLIPCEPAVGRLGREMLRSLKFFRSQFAEGSYLGMVGATTMSGGGTLLKGLDSCLQEQGIEMTSTVNPFGGLSVSAESGGIEHISGSAPAYTTAVGLALGDYWSARPQRESAAAA